MRPHRLLSACLCGLAFALPIAGARAQGLVKAPAYSSAGQPQAAIGVFCLNPDNTACSFAPSGGSSPANPSYVVTPGVTRTRTTCTLPAYASGGNAVCTDQAGQQTTTTCAANTACQILPANTNRRTFFIMNRTTGVTVDYAYSASVAPGVGIGIDGASTAGGQGAGFSEAPAHLGAYFAAAPSPATVVVVQGQ